MSSLRKDSHNLYKSGFSEEKGLIYLSEEELQRLQGILLSMLKDFLVVAEKYSLHYTLSGGSVLGAVRHEGFIPWDDDLDINMPRKDMVRLAEVFEQELGEKYSLYLPEDASGHGLAMAQIKKKGTVYRSFNELTKETSDCGIAMDLFVVENTFDNRLRRRIHGTLCLARGYLSTCRKTYEDLPALEQYLARGSDAERGFRRKARFGRLFSRISLDWIVQRTVRCYARCKNDASEYVTIPTGRAHYFGELRPRSELCETMAARFEGLTVQIPKGYDVYLTALYGADYRQLPPPEKQETHPLMELNLR